MNDEKDMTNNELKIYFDGRFDNVEKDIHSIKEDLIDIKVRLKKIEEDIHDLGNGKPGIGVRLDRLENSQKSAKESKKNWSSWIIPLAAALIGSFLGPFFASLFEK